MKAVVDWGFSADTAYQQSSSFVLSVPVGGGGPSVYSPVEGIEGFGNNMATPSNIYRTCGDWDVDQLWFGDDGPKAVYWDKGNHDRFINIINTQCVQYQTDPGWVSGFGGDSDQVYFFRLWYGVFNEALAFGMKWMGTKKLVWYGSNGEVLESEPIEPVYGTDYLARCLYNETELSLKIWLNEQLIINGTLNGPWVNNEFGIGTNARPLAHHFRFWGWKRGRFSTEEYELLKTNGAAMWPRGQLPMYPYIDKVGLGYGSYTDFNRDDNYWSLPAAFWDSSNFVGGTGVPGTHRLQWYYTNDDKCPGSLAIDCNHPLPNATGPIVYRGNYTKPGQPFYMHEGDSYNLVFCVITPVDSDGVEGIRIFGHLFLDNIV